MDFVWTLLDFSMELTKVCVELVWRLCFGVKIWMDFELWFYSHFWGDFGIDCRMVLCRVCGMFRGLNWKDNVAYGQGLFRDDFGSKIGVYQSCQGALWHADA